MKSRSFIAALIVLLPGLLLCDTRAAGAALASDAFAAGLAAGEAGDYAEAARIMRIEAGARPASGTLVNLGLAEWHLERVGAAILAWERALWVDPFEPRARGNLQFARSTLQLESPELTWYEVGSAWLPMHWWAWLVGGSLWFAVGMLTLPGLLRRRKAPWHQALAALGFAVLLLSLPAHVGGLTRARLGFVMEKDTLLRLTPTAEAEAVTRLAAGDPARCLRTRGDYVFIRANHASGWVRADQFSLICER